jgi:hypothetical protein
MESSNSESEQISTETTPNNLESFGLARLKSSSNMMNEIFDFMSGGDIVHKIGLLNKHFRQALKKLESFGSARIIELKIGNSGLQKCKRLGNLQGT